jgi:hypothetical protein
MRWLSHSFLQIIYRPNIKMIIAYLTTRTKVRKDAVRQDDTCSNNRAKVVVHKDKPATYPDGGTQVNQV